MNRILLVSPHLDDGILSCGAYIIKNIKMGNAITIATVFSGSLEAEKLSPLARWFHGICRLQDNAMEVRRLEDAKACSFLKSNYIHLNLHECLYRFDLEGNPRYNKEADIYSSSISREQDTLDRVCKVLTERLKLDAFDEILVPLGIGSHIDHIIVRHAVEALEKKNSFGSGKIVYYEDTPYVCTVNEAEWIEALTSGLTAKPYDISSFEFDTYIKALYHYSSQIDMIWESRTRMIEQLKDYYKKGNKNSLKGTLWIRQ